MRGLGSHCATRRLIALRVVRSFWRCRRRLRHHSIEHRAGRRSVLGCCWTRHDKQNTLSRPAAAKRPGLLDLAQLGPPPVAPRLPVQRELAVPSAPADVGEAQKGDGFRFVKTAPRAVRRCMAAELDQAHLVRMQAQREAFQPLAQIGGPRLAPPRRFVRSQRPFPRVKLSCR
jgi:hypothetical protein